MEIYAAEMIENTGECSFELAAGAARWCGGGYSSG
jgi:hypothetical protein